MNDNEAPATKGDIREAAQEIREFILKREVSSIRWFVSTFIGAQIAYFAITLGAVYFMLSHLQK
jgi:hypothetical protein